MIHYVDSRETRQKAAHGFVLRYARELKAAGGIRPVGPGSHNPAAAPETVRNRF